MSPTGQKMPRLGRSVGASAAPSVRQAPSGEQTLREAFSLYETFTSHFPKLDFKDFCNLTRSEIKLNKSFHPLKFQAEKLGIK
jgi:hypothetical protein